MNERDAVMAALNAFAAGVSFIGAIVLDENKRLFSVIFLMINVIAVVLWLT
jgi:hypothetical protein